MDEFADKIRVRQACVGFILAVRSPAVVFVSLWLVGIYLALLKWIKQHTVCAVVVGLFITLEQSLTFRGMSCYSGQAQKEGDKTPA